MKACAADGRGCSQFLALAGEAGWYAVCKSRYARDGWGIGKRWCAGYGERYCMYAFFSLRGAFVAGFVGGMGFA